MYPKLWSDEVEARIRKEARNLDPQRTPDHVQMCRKCVITNQRPRISLDSDGICSACRYWESKQNGTIDWASRERQLCDLLDRHRRGSGYDVIVPCSGGKDSAYVISRLSNDLGMHPLGVCWAPFIYTETGWKNMQALIHSGYDVITMQPNGLIHRQLARLSLEYYGDPFQPFVYGQLCWPMNAAKMLGVDLVFFGENGEAEYGGDTSANDKPCWDQEDWSRVYTKEAGVTDLCREINLLGNGLRFSLLKSDLSPFYNMPNGISGRRPEFHWFGYYTPWHPMENFYHATEHTGFQANDERSEATYTKLASLDDKLDGLHYWFAYLKFGIGRCTSDAAQQVRAGDITRDEALALVKRYDHERPTKYLPECLDYLGLDEDHLRTIEERFRAKV